MRGDALVDPAQLPDRSDTQQRGSHDREALVRDAVRANVRVSVRQLRHGSELVEQLIAQGDLAVVGAEYSLETGVVDFFDGGSV